jgi:hypothetical protein
MEEENETKEHTMGDEDEIKKKPKVEERREIKKEYMSTRGWILNE